MAHSVEFMYQTQCKCGIFETVTYSSLMFLSTSMSADKQKNFTAEMTHRGINCFISPKICLADEKLNNMIEEERLSKWNMGIKKNSVPT